MELLEVELLEVELLEVVLLEVVLLGVGPVLGRPTWTRFAKWAK